MEIQVAFRYPISRISLPLGFSTSLGRTTFCMSRGGVIFASSIHSNPRVLKLNRKSPYGRIISPYDEEEDDDDSDCEDFSDDECSDLEGFNDESISRKKHLSDHDTKNGNSQRKSGGGRSSSITGILKNTGSSDIKLRKNIKLKNSAETYYSDVAEVMPVDAVGRGQGSIAKYMFQNLKEELGLDEKWFPLVEYLSTFGLRESDFVSIYERHMPCFQINVTSAQERLEFLLKVGVKVRDIRKILYRQPQILEYTVENNLKPHVAFLKSIGIPDSRIGQIIASAPSFFSYSIELSLMPTIRYLVEEVGIKGNYIGKVVQLSPQILVQRIDNSWTSRLYFLSKDLGAPRESIVKMVTKHPQLLHYSIEDGIQPRINFLRSIGMQNPEIVKILTSLTQVLSLSLEANLKPKYLYLVNDLRNEVQSLTKYPMYLSLSLEQRIRPRHRFLVSLKKAPKGPFPLSWFVPTDESFCQQWAGTSVEKYLAFRQTMLLSNFAKKYERK